VLTGEFINVGIILHSPAGAAGDAVVLSRVRRTIGRLKGAFPGLDRDAFLRAVRALEKGLERVTSEVATEGLFRTASDVGGLARKVLPTDDSSFQWSPVGSGVSDNLSIALDRLYNRMVAGYDRHAAPRRSDDEVWKPVRQRLEKLDVKVEFQEKTISSGVDQIEFRHAWKNGHWHVYEPLSFDLADSDGIKDKARRWLGHLTAVSVGADEEFRPYFIVGAPSDQRLMPAYRNAIAILQRAPLEPRIFEESDVDEFVAQIEDEVRFHHAM
jgi:hypothetical protein